MKVIQPITVTDAMVVSTNLYDIPPTAYAAGTTYAAGVYTSVVGVAGEVLIYKSLQAGNVGHTPASSPLWWVYSSSTYTTWVQTQRGARTSQYTVGTRVYDSTTGYIYESLAADNTSVLNPIDNPPWGSIGIVTDPIVPPVFDVATTYNINDLVISNKYVNTGGELTHRSVYKSLIGSNTGNAPPSSPAAWVLVDYYPLPWLFTGIYAAGDVAYKEDKSLWKSLVSGNQNNIPTSSVVPLWLKLQPSNRTAAFDTQTSTSSTANNEITFTVATGIIDTVGLVGSNADTAVITARNGLDGAIIYQKTIGLTGGNPTNAWDYYFSEPTIRSAQAVAEDIPHYPDCHVTVTLTGDGTISIGNIIFGRSKEVGLAEYGVSAGIADFSTKTTDTFGKTTFVKRGYKKRVNCRCFVDNSRLNAIQNNLYALRAEPCLWILASDTRFSEALIIYGFYKDFSTDIAYPTNSYINIEIEGLI